MTDKRKQEIKGIVNKLASVNLEFTIEDELEFAKVAVKNAEQKLKAKEQECKELEQQYKELQEDLLNCTACRATGALKQQLDQLKAENEKLKEKFKNFFDIDNQECWDIAFLKDENAKYKQAVSDIEEFCLIYRENPVEGTAYCKVLEIINKAKEQ